ncbi:hypothetical protein ASPWEDRAFT_150886 [Aspergillus wentii DTO 134E9]|uniref:Uncharacterized protein n=1 Tax=Aspergillus wentii DTO 134E9 TaxID=1073089 RepID=A0A1L9RXC2_ASPWE|nr:uncharacterized protein ASPWEDRAFT_150886 [Aspergillus wentii DTO 134E9]KAI9931721.1 hypothetical protein MW887_010300 [Aspergillus wentii]OJJ39601.1 hypothetical protein ASPWEDRAFT_150886 [Aspergillus wentii DTO 134E9]
MGSALTVGSSALFLAILTSLPALRSCASHLRSKRTKNASGFAEPCSSYCDQDGEATAKSLAAFSDRWNRVVIFLLAVAGLAVSLSLAVISTIHNHHGFVIESWLLSGIWMLLSFQAAVVFLVSSPKTRFSLIQSISGASILAGIVPWVEISLSYPSGTRPSPISIRFYTAQSVIAVLCIVVGSLLPRRPDVYTDGKVVDQESSVSLLSRYSFHWVDGLLKRTGKNKGIEVDDLPALPYPLRSKTLCAKFASNHKAKQKLWKTIILTHKGPVVLQLALTLLNAVLSFCPQVILYQILSSLEANSGDTRGWGSAVWILMFGGQLLLSSAVKQWLFWVIYSRIGIPVYEELTAIIFDKAMRQKDIRKAPTKRPSPGQGESTSKSNRSVINLATVDARRIADFASFGYRLPSSVLKLSVACALLIRLIGWRSLACGLGSFLLLMPVNMFVARRYSRAQKILMSHRDQKMAVVTEILRGIRQVKLSAMEGEYQSRILAARQVELRALWRSFLYNISLSCLWIFGPLLLSTVSLGAYSILHGDLSASVAFTAMSIFGSLEMTLSILPEMISSGLEAKISCERIEAYLTTTPERQVVALPDEKISLQNATISWASNPEQPSNQQRFVLRNLNLTFSYKGLSIISGKTGSGKSLLLASLLGECDLLSGAVTSPSRPQSPPGQSWIVDGAIAYVAQIPWIENATVKDNILFGLPYNAARYQQTLFACALEKDLEMLEDKDLTEIGADGVNLSGGQRWRVSLARALYSRAGVLILDDIFSALDTHTGEHVYRHALVGPLGAGRTRILATHHASLCLGHADYSVVLENGGVGYAGPVDNGEKREEMPCPDEFVGFGQQPSGAVSSTQTSVDQTSSSRKAFTQEETRGKGSIKLSMWAAYFRMGGRVPWWVLVISGYLSYVLFYFGRAWWVNVWTKSTSTHLEPERHLNIVSHSIDNVMTVSQADHPISFYLEVYIALSIATFIFGATKYYLLLCGTVEASKNLFDQLTYTVLRAPLRWLDTVPLGRILNRFTMDFHLIDSRLAVNLGNVTDELLQVLGITLSGILVSPLLAVFSLILLLLCLQISSTYLAGAREIKRLESVARSPISDQFETCLTGLTTIRAFGRVGAYLDLIHVKVDRHARAWSNLWLFNRWLGFRISVVGVAFSTATAALVMYTPGVTASLAGFALSFSLQYSNAISMSLKQYANTEMNMNSTERAIEYSRIETEDQGGLRPPAAWPTSGRLEIEDLAVSYASDLPPVLDGLTFSAVNERVGVVGRTGAGKSTLSLALFRFLEARRGSIHIDGIDISKINLHDLRSRLAIIPQDPVLFSGTIRSNLDPFSQHTDAEVLDALERVHLINSDEACFSTDTEPGHTQPPNIFTSLTSTISEGGLNLSQGQRQLLCLARAILSQPKIMVLDETTSAVDMDTDKLIQRSIREELPHVSTLLVIAHRLSTIADFDKILVLDAGRGVEFGTPRDLMEQGGAFRELVERSSERDVLHGIIYRDECE